MSSVCVWHVCGGQYLVCFQCPGSVYSTHLVCECALSLSPPKGPAPSEPRCPKFPANLLLTLAPNLSQRSLLEEDWGCELCDNCTGDAA